MDDRIVSAVNLIQNDRVAGMKALKRLADSGNASAILYFALHLGEETGRQVEEIDWLIKADGLGFSDASWNLAMIANQNGDVSGIRKWIDRSASLSNPDALLVLSMNYDVQQFISGIRG